jgi:hypothetical protein
MVTETVDSPPIELVAEPESRATPIDVAACPFKPPAHSIRPSRGLAGVRQLRACGPRCCARLVGRGMAPAIPHERKQRHFADDRQCRSGRCKSTDRRIFVEGRQPSVPTLSSLVAEEAVATIGGHVSSGKRCRLRGERGRERSVDRVVLADPGCRVVYSRRAGFHGHVGWLAGKDAGLWFTIQTIKQRTLRVSCYPSSPGRSRSVRAS